MARLQVLIFQFKMDIKEVMVVVPRIRIFITTVSILEIKEQIFM